MNHFAPLNYGADPQRFYRDLAAELRATYTSHWITNLSTFSATLMAHLPQINWVGFYLNDGTGELHLGPFQGLPACLHIPLGKGVCGAAAATKITQRIDDVHAFAGHIACDPRSRSELVVPLLNSSNLLGVLDLDSPEPARFTTVDQSGVEALARDLLQSCPWPYPLIQNHTT